MKRLFLAGYAGAEVNKPQTINGFNFEPPVISMNKTREAESSGRKFLMRLQELFEELGVEACSIREEGSNDNVRLKLSFSADQNHSWSSGPVLAIFTTPHKQRLGVAASGRLRWKLTVLGERQRVAIMVADSTAGDTLSRP